jgi:hypothetical protein
MSDKPKRNVYHEHPTWKKPGRSKSKALPGHPGILIERGKELASGIEREQVFYN